MDDLGPRMSNYLRDGVSFVDFAWVQASGLSELISRYPHDVAQGTAIPYWAFYDVTVRYVSTLLPIGQEGFTCCAPTLESPRRNLQRRRG